VMRLQVLHTVQWPHTWEWCVDGAGVWCWGFSGVGWLNCASAHSTYSGMERCTSRIVPVQCDP
jgi:hypothetical protein